MPRLSTPLILRARALRPLLPLLLRPCRDLPSARNELRWLREHAIANRQVTLTSSGLIHTSWPQHLYRMCLERARGKPLQYILGSQPFGQLEILCKRGALIPRPETENLTTHLASLLLSSPSPPPNTLRILDLCTGTGCIPLLLYSLLSSRIPSLHLCGVDISTGATSLATKNLSHSISTSQLPQTAREQISFVRDDIFAAGTNAWNRSKWDILISNPPYISPTSFNSTTTRSVRNYEPRSALVPSSTPSPKSRVAEVDAGDMFYPRLLEIAAQVSARVLLVEVGDLEQAFRVVAMVAGKREGVWEGCEIWRDWPAGNGEGGAEWVKVGGYGVRVRGEGNGRAVLAWKGDGRRMLGM